MSCVECHPEARSEVEVGLAMHQLQVEREREPWMDHPWLELPEERQAVLGRWRERWERLEATQHGGQGRFLSKAAEGDLLAFLKTMHLEQYARDFRKHEVALQHLPFRSKPEFREMGLPLGPATALFEHFLQKKLRAMPQ